MRKSKNYAVITGAKTIGIVAKMQKKKIRLYTEQKNPYNKRILFKKENKNETYSNKYFNDPYGYVMSYCMRQW